ncbi:MAG TPA: sigma-70 family RNA polymerase sigma factor [Ideonella sp.]|nr:sigma-70 family RNA polymerase sigma factor [Ideonella sp.]
MPAWPDEAELTACLPSLRRYARGLARERDGADDLVQDTLERAWAARWQRRGDTRAWLFGIMHNLFVDRLRRQQRSPEVGSLDETSERAVAAAQTDRLELRDLERALARLPAEQREVLLLVGVESLAYAEVAAVVGVPVGTVMSRLSRARERLRQELEGRRGDEPRIQRVK